MNYIAYKRTSTKDQHLGIEAQEKAINDFISNDDVIISSYTEHESGRKDNRPELLKAIAECTATGSTLLIARLDRLSRSVTTTYQLLNSNVQFKCCDMPEANSLTIGIMSVLAQSEAERISRNTSKALQVLISQGVKMGTNNLTQAAKELGAKTKKEQAEKDNYQSSKIIVRLREEGRTYKSIADELNADGYTTSIGGKWSERTVNRMYKRAKK